MAYGIEPVIAIAADERIDGERGAHGHRIASQRRAGRHRERERRNPPRGDARERAALANRLTHAPEIDGLQIAQTAVDRFQMVE